MADLIISQAEMASIAAEFGPKVTEEVAYIVRESTEVQREGVGKKKPIRVTSGPYGCRVIYVGNMTVREKDLAGQIATAGDYIVSLPAGTVVFTSDVVKVTGPLWEPRKRFISGRRCTPTDNPDLIFVCSKTGATGTDEPNWELAVKPGEKIVDGTIEWTKQGEPLEYEVIQIAGPSTYSDMFSTKFAGKLRQKVMAK